MDCIILSHCTINSDTPDRLNCSLAWWPASPLLEEAGFCLCMHCRFPMIVLDWITSLHVFVVPTLQRGSGTLRAGREKSLFQKLLWEEERSLWSQNVSLTPARTGRQGKHPSDASEVIGSDWEQKVGDFQNHTVMSFILKDIKHCHLTISEILEYHVEIIWSKQTTKKTIVVFLKILM